MKKALLRFTVIIIIAVMVSVSFLSGCTQPDAGVIPGNGEDSPVATEKILRMSVSGTPLIDPGLGLDQSSMIAMLNIYDTLVFPKSGEIMPHLAEDWEVSEDGLSYTFYLREGVKFQNGDELTASDVVFTMNRLLTMGEGFAYLFVDIVENVTAVDDYTVRFDLKLPFGPFINTLARCYILNESEVMENIEDGPYGDMGDYGRNWLLTNGAGSGPYIPVELVQQGHLYAVRFDDYWGGWDNPDSPDAIKLIDTTESATIRTMLSNRELEVTDPWQTSEALSAMASLPGVEIASNYSGLIQNMMLNNQKPPTDDVNFRKALSYLFDYELISNDILIDSPIAMGPVTSGTPGHNANLYQYSLNLEKAKEYLEKSKYGDQLDEYPIELLVNTDTPDHEKIALAFQAEAEKVGLTVEISKAPWMSITEQVSSIESTPNVVCISVGLHYPEAGAMLQTRYHSQSAGTWESAEWALDPELDAMIEDALATVDQSERFDKYKNIQNILVTDMVPSVWLGELTERSAYNSEYVYWPAAELGEMQLMGYQYYFKDFKIYPDEM